MAARDYYRYGREQKFLPLNLIHLLQYSRHFIYASLYTLADARMAISLLADLMRKRLRRDAASFFFPAARIIIAAHRQLDFSPEKYHGFSRLFGI